MGKAQKIKVSKKNQVSSVAPLGDQLHSAEVAAPSGRVKERNRLDEDEDYVESRLSKNIITQARLQAAEIEQEFKKPDKVKSKSIKLGGEDSDEEDDLELQKYEEKEIVVDEDDDLAVKMFMNPVPSKTRTLADIINDKITEKQTEIASQYTDATEVAKDLSPEVTEMYTEVGKLLQNYRSGKIPKAFKVLPQFRNWEQLLHLTNPDKWSAAAMYQATRIFTSSLKERMAQRFFNLVLLPRVRDDIDTYNQLNFHLYQALRKSLFKPGAFFKGMLLPLCEERNCTLKEAVVFASILAKNSIPVLHSCAAMIKIAEMEYSGGNSIFLRTLCDKKYALPYRVIDALVFHFLGFRSEKRTLPVLWHQAFLSFVQRYKADISSEQKEALLDLLKIQNHHKISEEIRRELIHSKCRDEEMDEPPASAMEL